jgi:hypothetical protein
MVDHRYDALPGETAEEHKKRTFVIHNQIKAEEAAQKAAEAEEVAKKAKKEAEEAAKKVQLNKIKLTEENMAEDGLVTRNELIKRDIDAMRKEIESEISDVREADQETKGKVKELDDKQCADGKCMLDMQKKQDEMFKILQEGLKSLAEPRFVCNKCHSSSIRKGDKACPVCGDAVSVVWT